MTTSVTRRLDFSDVYLYGVTTGANDGAALLKKIDQVLAGGIDAIQLRSSELTDRAFVELAITIKDKCHAAGALFLVNNRADLALASMADGVHIGHNDLPLSLVRELVGHRKIIGVSTHSLPQALAAQRAGADYVSCGPIWATPTKPDYEPVGVNLIGLYKAALKIPFVVIGGVDATNINDVLEAGASRVAVVRALFEAGNPQAVAQSLKQKIRSNP